MTANAAALAATVILLFTMGYFFLASPAFLLVKLDIPQVSQLLRGMFNIQFVMMSVAGVGRIGPHQQRVAVGSTARDFLGAKAAECAGAVFDHHRLAKGILQMLAHEARHLIRPGAGGKRHNDLDLPRGVFVGGGVRRDKPRQDETGE